MTTHYGTADLLQYAWLPDADAAIAQHLASCDACRERLAALRRELEKDAEENSSAGMPETFWKRQELGVMRAIERQAGRRGWASVRYAAAAALIVVVSAFLLGRGSVVSPEPQGTSAVTATVASTATAAGGSGESGLTTNQITTDPWASEQLQDFQTVVDWETWVEDDGKNRGTI